jgi:hypothetical protein
VCLTVIHNRILYGLPLGMSCCVIELIPIRNWCWRDKTLLDQCTTCGVKWEKSLAICKVSASIFLFYYLCKLISMKSNKIKYIVVYSPYVWSCISHNAKCVTSIQTTVRSRNIMDLKRSIFQQAHTFHCCQKKYHIDIWGNFNFWPSYENFQSSRPRGSRQT